MGLNIEAYAMPSCCVLLLSSGILAFGLILNGLNYGIYGEVVYNEVSSWDKGAIVDVISVDLGNSCPDGYEKLTSLYLGTDSYCLSWSGSYRKGTCGKNKAGRTISGFSDTLLNQFLGEQVCYKRSALTYHDVIAHRLLDSLDENNQTVLGACQTGETLCGPSDHSEELSYCIVGQCPYNGIAAAQQNSTNKPTNYNTTFNYNTDWSVYLDINAQHEAASDLYLSLSQPCFDTQYPYVQRNVGINPIYDTGDCPGDIDGVKTHQGYLETGLVETEREMLRENQILNGVANKIPRFSDAELKLNNFQLYYKPYAHWKQSCQARFTTKDVQKQAEECQDIQQSTKGVLISSCVQFIVCFIFFIIIAETSKKCAHENAGLITIIVQMVCMIASIMTVMGFYISLIHDLNEINAEQIQFIVDSQCSDHVVNYSFSQLLKNQSNFTTYTIIGLVIVILAIIVQICAMCAAFGYCGRSESSNHSSSDNKGGAYGTFQSKYDDDNQHHEIKKEHGGDFKHNF